MDSFVEAQNRLKRMSYRGAITLFKNAAKPRSSLLVHTCGREVTGLKTYRGPKRKEQPGICSIPGYSVPGGLLAGNPPDMTPKGPGELFLNANYDRRRQGDLQPDSGSRSLREI